MADYLVSVWHHTYGLPTLTTYCTNNFGPHQDPEKLIPHPGYCALAGKALKATVVWHLARARDQVIAAGGS